MWEICGVQGIRIRGGGGTVAPPVGKKIVLFGQKRAPHVHMVRRGLRSYDFDNV